MNKTSEIKNRMIKRAASLWGVQPNEIETSFDPLVTLLIDACATEVAKISSEVNNSQSRITEQLVQLMTPETLYGVRPAHGIAHVMPVASDSDIKPENLFYYNKKIGGDEANLKNIFFSPVQEFKLVNAAITHMLCDHDMYQVEMKTLTSVSEEVSAESTPSPSTIYLGIQPGNDNVDLINTSLFFEIMDVQDRELFYHHLRQAEFFYQEERINISVGYKDNELEEMKDLEALFSATPDKTRNIESDVKKIYAKHFVTINSSVMLDKGAKVPDEVMSAGGAELEEVCWIKVVFPSVISNTVLKNVFCSFNAFPVINRNQQLVSYQLKDFIDIVPVSTLDMFLDVKSVTNTSGQQYYHKENTEGQEEKGTYELRRDNLGKLDSRKAREYLLHMVDLLKDESAAFSLYGNDFLQTIVKKLNQNIASLEKKLIDINEYVAETNYLTIKPYKPKDTLLVEYWVTNGEEANHIKTGSALQTYKGSELRQKGVFLTSTFQGKNALNTEERLQAYRRALLTRNRIVTKEDVKALCFELCGNKVEQVEIKKVFKNSVGNNKGLIPTMEISLTASQNEEVSDYEWDAIKSNLLNILEKQSLSVFPYFVTVLK
ncbi:type VI secretion system baseplate subunit TssF [Fulvivirga sediminis]|uniref:Type VI secretion system baseplate subunit TssF n=1 Tax=Fulvivirga sediminis TaxID=2803949 RepID=A0A937JZK8_9BACT|nr:type VI secretion system baseplate subunit TssF [Fulvivirga sediminis]MBL3656754.1 type VI secretion system baseplate subunit TssF [Fulvivirga sediminis]